jgi:hypothetical protein
MGSPWSRNRHIGPAIGDIRLGQDDIFNATACPAGIGKGGLDIYGFIFEMDESVKASAEVVFTTAMDCDLFNRTMAGAWVRYPSLNCDF